MTVNLIGARGRAAILTLLAASFANCAEPPAAATANPLEPFARLIGGQWRSADNYHVFEWGLGKLSVVTRSYFVIEGQPKQVSSGLWYWHPGDQTIKAIATATDMPMTLFEYTTTFEGDVLRSEMTTYTAAGEAEHYIETWEFADDDTYVWSLMTEGDAGLETIMGSTYMRGEAPTDPVNP